MMAISFILSPARYELALQASVWKSDLLHYLLLAACVLVGLVGLGLWIASLAAGWYGLQRKHQQTATLTLASLSNLTTFLQLRVDLNGLEKKLRLAWWQDGERLHFTSIQKTTYVEEVIPPVSSSKKGSKKAGKNKPGKKDGLQQEYQKVNRFANLAASISSTLAALLPGSLKTPFRSFADGIRKEQQAVGQVKSQKDRLESSTRSLDTSVRQLGSAAGVKTRSQQAAAAGKAGFPEGPSRRLVSHDIPVVFTRPLTPSETSTCSLVLRPRNPFRSLAGEYQIASTPLEVKEFPVYGGMNNQVLSGSVDMKASLAADLALFGFLCLASLAINAWWCQLVIRWLYGLQ